MSDAKRYKAALVSQYSDVVLSIDHDAALAAKDARIAELEEHCKRLGAGDAERYWEGRWRDADAELSRLRDAATPSEDGPNYDKFYAGLYHKSSPMWKELHDLAVSKGYDHVRFAIECAPVYKCDCMGARKVAIDMNGNTMPCECVEAANGAPPSEDGGEAPVVVRHWHNKVECRVEPLMTVAQHSRIVAAKDAEIARLRELHENAHSAAKTLMAERATLMEQAAHWLEVNAPSGGCIETNIADQLRAEAEQLRAKPARQVGGDELSELERLMGMLPLLPWRAEKYNKDSATYSNALGGKPSFKPVYLEPMHLLIAQDELGWPLADFIAAAANALPGLIAQARAALAPAAVCADSRPTLGYSIKGNRYMITATRGEIPDVYADNQIIELVDRAAIVTSSLVIPSRKAHPGASWSEHIGGYNAALDEVSRLNRRAIPVELLKRACKDYTVRENWDALEPDRLAAVAELRALLGKEGER